jgi:hypothetical protein
MQNLKALLLLPIPIPVAHTQPLWAALGAKNRVCYAGILPNQQPQLALTYCYLSVASQQQIRMKR